MDQDIITVVDMIRNDTLLGPVGQGIDPAEAWR